MSQTIVADGRGRLLLPKPIRERLGLEPGRAVDVDIDPDGTVRLRDGRIALADKLDALHGAARDAPGSSAQLIADRRREAALEND